MQEKNYFWPILQKLLPIFKENEVFLKKSFLPVVFDSDNVILWQINKNNY